MFKLLYALLAAGTALTNSTAETVLSSTELPAYSKQRAKVTHITGSVIATATNATDTLTVRVRMGPTTLTGTVLANSGAVDVANNDVVVYDIWCTTRSTGSTGVALCNGVISAPGAEGTATARAAFEQVTVDTSLAQKIEVTGQWSVANAGNSCRADSMVVQEGI